jgi:hypothetical protein
MTALCRTDGQVLMQAGHAIWGEVVNQGHLRSLVREYLGYYHEDRTRDGLGKDTPDQRPGHVLATNSKEQHYTRRSAVVTQTRWPTSSAGL